MSKGKKARFHIKKGERLLKKGMMDYCVTGRYGHAAMGDAFLTDSRFYFGAELHDSKEYLSLEIPLKEINMVTKKGVPFLTRSVLVIADGRPYRFNAFIPGRWVKAIRKAVDGARETL